MNTIINHYKKIVAFLVLAIILLTPTKSFAHDAYFFQVLIDDHKYQYVSSVVEDNATLFSNEAKHLEKELGKYQGLPWNVRPYKEDYKKYEDDSKFKNDTLSYSFPPAEVKGFWGNALNSATKEDVEKAYFIQENLGPALNDALQYVNDGKSFTSIKELRDMGQELAIAINVGGKVNGYTIKKGKTLDSKKIKGISKDDYVTISKGKEVVEFPYRIKKGYVGKKDEFKDDLEYISWHNMMYQANYSYAMHGYTLRSAAEISKPTQLEEMVVGMFENTFNQLRNLLGLYDINDLVFNDGIRGSSAWTHGIMSKQWSDQAIAYHWLFQALAWSVITFAIVKNLMQRNLATINPAMKITLMESVQNLMITGFLLANAIPVINMMMYLNAKLVSVFGATAPDDFSNLSGANGYTNMLGGIIIQFVYLGISIYLNFVYIMRGITIAILIATAPMFIVTIAFGGKWKELFSTWIRELTGNIFLQSFHAFILSFFFAVTTSSRGIEGIIVMFALIPMTEFFRTLVLGQSGGIAHSLGGATMAQTGALIGGATNKMTGVGKKGVGGASKSGGSGGSGGSSREVSSSSTNDSGMNNLAGNSDKIKKSSENMNQRQRMNSTKETMANKQIPISASDTKNHQSMAEHAGRDLSTEPQSKMEKAIHMAQGVGEKYSEMKDSTAMKGVSGVADVASGVAKTALGGATMAVGLGTAMAVGAHDPKMLNSSLRHVGDGADMASSGHSQVNEGANGLNTVANTALSEGFRKKNLPSSTQSYASTLPNGDMQVHRPLSAMKQEGVLGATMDSNNNASYTYDVGKLQPQQREQLYGHAFNSFKNNDKEAISHYKSQGIEYMNRNAQGNLVVGYNQVGMEKMGIKSVQTIGASGSNARIVETKTPSMPVETAKTIATERYVPQASSDSQRQNNSN